MTLELLSSLVSLVLIILGFVSIILPIVPSVATIWFGIFLYAVSHKFTVVSKELLFVMFLIAAVTMLLDYALGRQGSRKLKAGPWGVLGAIVGGAAGSFFSPLVAYVVAPVIGAIAFELLRGRDHVFTYETGHYTVVAFMGATLLKLTAAIVLVGLFFLRIQGKI